MKIFKNTNRIKITIVFLFIFILGIFSFLVFENYTLNKVNENYIKQNMAIVGALSNENINVEKSVIPIIINNNGEINESNVSKGKELFKKFSYTTELNKNYNSILKGPSIISELGLIAIWFILLLLLFIYVIGFSSNIFKYIDKLTSKAEDVVEGRFSKRLAEDLKDNRFNKLENQFFLMEKRIERSIDELKKEKTNLKDVINDISHQLKTPLAALIMYNEIVSDPNADREEISYFNELTKEQLARMEWLIMTLLKYAKLECNSVEYNKINKSLKKTIENSIDALKFKAEENNQKIILKSNIDIEYLHDRKWLEEAIVNIIKNALEHSPKGGEVEVLLKSSELFSTIEIKDYGEGIDKEELKHIFKRFYKGKKSTNPQSVGIGLALSKSIIEGNGGTIKVESEVGEGTKFIISFLKK